MEQFRTKIRNNEPLREVDLYVQEYEFVYINAIIDGIVIQNGNSKLLWSLKGAIYYCVTTYTLIGFGNLAPRTNLGRLIAIFYSGISIPVGTLVLGELGDFIVKALKFFYVLLLKCFRCRRKNKNAEKKEAAKKEAEKEAEKKKPVGKKKGQRKGRRDAEDEGEGPRKKGGGKRKKGGGGKGRRKKGGGGKGRRKREDERGDPRKKGSDRKKASKKDGKRKRPRETDDESGEPRRKKSDKRGDKKKRGKSSGGKSNKSRNNKESYDSDTCSENQGTLQGQNLSANVRYYTLASQAPNSEKVDMTNNMRYSEYKSDKWNQHRQQGQGVNKINKINMEKKLRPLYSCIEGNKQKCYSNEIFNRRSSGHNFYYKFSSSESDSASHCDDIFKSMIIYKPKNSKESNVHLDKRGIAFQNGQQQLCEMLQTKKFEISRNDQPNRVEFGDRMQHMCDFSYNTLLCSNNNLRQRISLIKKTSRNTPELVRHRKVLNKFNDVSQHHCESQYYGIMENSNSQMSNFRANSAEQVHEKIRGTKTYREKCQKYRSILPPTKISLYLLASPFRWIFVGNVIRKFLHSAMRSLQKSYRIQTKLQKHTENIKGEVMPSSEKHRIGLENHEKVILCQRQKLFRQLAVKKKLGQNHAFSKPSLRTNFEGLGSRKDERKNRRAVFSPLYHGVDRSNNYRDRSGTEGDDTAEATSGDEYTSGSTSKSAGSKNKKEEEEVAEDPGEDEDEEEEGAPVMATIAVTCGYIIGGAVFLANFSGNLKILDSIWFLYISMVTIGYGDVVPYDQEVFIYMLPYIFIGLSLMSTVLNDVTSYFTNNIVKARNIGQEVS
ncbi:potassium channel subfamily K member 18 [Elysia marginata]|uniref:Potassium channel subfamily K member 18 n=1 Tax=Elysia marginata TaxID=1093978 RepID=A0AAV4GZB0_9GAST|nr:potassium channel subfamily K member 18 [Elysia marginata]